MSTLGIEIGCYVLHVYCANPSCPNENGLSQQRWDEFTGHNLREARREAREDGWTRRQGLWWCPECKTATE